MHLKNNLLAVFLLLSGSLTAQKANYATQYAQTITACELRDHLEILASDAFEGRETGEIGQKKAAHYLSTYFEALGIPPYNGESYLQPFMLYRQQGGGSLFVEGKQFNFMKDFYYIPGYNDTSITTDEVVFVGYGIEDKSSGYSDYKDIDVEGKILLALEGEPIDKEGKSLLTGEKPSTYGYTSRSKIKVAKEKGAQAIIFIVDDMAAKLSRIRYFLGSGILKLATEVDKDEDKDRLSSFFISQKVANSIFSESNTNVDELKENISKNKTPESKNIKTEINISLDENANKVKSENVLAFIEGGDLKEEIIVITAHYDHIGKDSVDIYNGADDDGSGTVALMELAEAFQKAKKNGHGPRRSILIMAVSGEEKGLLGSQYYVENPVYPLKNTVVDLNIDMIGRMDEDHSDSNYVYLIGSDKLSTELHQISEEVNDTYTDLKLDYTYNDPNDPNRFYYRSDHYNFAKNNIPVIFYFSGVHEDYHGPGDTADKIMYGKMEKIVKLIFHTAWELANRNERIVVDVTEK